MTAVAAKIDDWGKPAWIALMILGFMVWWPLGLATLAFLIGSRRMACGHHRGFNWPQAWGQQGWGQNRGFGTPWNPSSGNRAFDDYKMETLRRLEDEQREFREFLQRLRMAKDKAEFDQFMAERRNRPQTDTPPQQN
jgi:Protein of unknown function (DUF2852)